MPAFILLQLPSKSPGVVLICPKHTFTVDPSYARVCSLDILDIFHVKSNTVNIFNNNNQLSCVNNGNHPTVWFKDNHWQAWYDLPVTGSLPGDARCLKVGFERAIGRFESFCARLLPLLA